MFREQQAHPDVKIVLLFLGQPSPNFKSFPQVLWNHLKLSFEEIHHTTRGQGLDQTHGRTHVTGCHHHQRGLQNLQKCTNQRLVGRMGQAAEEKL